MVKKITAVLICVFMILALVPFTASAEETVEFKICGISQDNKNVNVSIDYKGSKGFNALDFSVKYNQLKLSVEEIAFASGFAEFKKHSDEKGGGVIFNASQDKNPVKVTIATIMPFEVINNDGSIVRIKFSKIANANVDEKDLELTIDNCQDSNFKNISTKVSYDLSDGASSSVSDKTVAREVLPEEKTGQNAADKNTKDNNEKTDKNGKAETSSETSVTEKTAVQIAQAKTEAGKAKKEPKPEKVLSNLDKTIVVIIIAVVLLAVTGVLFAIIRKNKEKNSTPKIK